MNESLCQLLVGIFSHAIGIEQKLREFASAHGCFDSVSYYAIQADLNRLKDALHKVDSELVNLPSAIYGEVEAIALAVDDRTGCISHGDYCKHLFESELDTHGERGWQEVLRVTRRPDFEWAKHPPERPYTVADLVADLANTEHLEKRIEEISPGVALKFTEADSPGSSKQQSAIRLQQEKSKLTAKIIAQPGVERLRTRCEASGSQWSKDWAVQQRAAYCETVGIGQATVNVMTVAEFVERLAPAVEDRKTPTTEAPETDGKIKNLTKRVAVVEERTKSKPTAQEKKREVKLKFIRDRIAMKTWADIATDWRADPPLDWNAEYLGDTMCLFWKRHGDEPTKPTKPTKPTE